MEKFTISEANYIKITINIEINGELYLFKKINPWVKFETKRKDNVLPLIYSKFHENLGASH